MDIVTVSQFHWLEPLVRGKALVIIYLTNTCIEYNVNKCTHKSYKGAIIFYREGGASVCDHWSQFFLGPPPWHVKKNSGPPPPRWKNTPLHK